MTPTRCISERLVLALLLSAATVDSPVRAQHTLDAESALEHIQIPVATRIEGRLLSLDTYDDAIWVEYSRFFDGRSWRPVPFEAELLLYARDVEMMKFFRSLPRGTMLRMTIFIDDQGKRQVVELEGT